ncbi:RecQ family ATP-dependent DNA helicase [Pseudobdellovibrio exovorus]|uniref:ATP-dependent DNA helicase RecQ n=1 Tax=Pseudobdellovibrio exovorus JSS TaxID=1184267 RepID=M4VPH7_9BACT|nr:RecQ family ATP-dependent DNA helicase [Pseudobdellovibrio exovorus]AGH95024.1 ATP-dependent DNA helicase RecQ [Pseudobdellovibrio exovorus JSS]
MLDLQKHLQSHFGYPDFRYPQRQIIEKVLNNKSLFALMPTGAGKSLTYQFTSTLTQKNELVLVVSPLIALMQDQSTKARDFKISSTYINSSLSAEEKQKRMQSIAEGQYQLIFVAPERFQKPEFWECLKSRQIKLFVVDEAHCISLWGHDFRPDYTKLQQYRERLGSPPVLALTATATEDVQQDILKMFLLDKNQDLILGGIERPNLSLNIFECYGEAEKNDQLLELLKSSSDTAENSSGIIYFSLIQTLENCSRFLQSAKIPHLKYHGDLPANIRRRQQEDFLKNKTPLILATPAFGLGVDKPDIRFVIHYEIPSSIEAYFQEVGRAGRDGETASGQFLFSEDDLSIQMQFLNWAYPESEFIAKVYDLISSRPDVVSQQGFDFLREQMVFKNKKDFRVNAAVSILLRWGCLEENDTPFGYQSVREPQKEDFELEDQNTLKKEHQKKLLALLRFIQNDKVCRLKQIYQYFSHQIEEDCGICDVCR